MGEAAAIASSERPATRSSIAGQLRALGVEADMTVMVHSSLSRLGFVLGGAQTIVQTLLDVVGPVGTLRMSTHSGALCDPAITPSRGMGAVAECFRCVPGVQRSNHPTVSAAAIGPKTPALLNNHDLEDRLGNTSPQGKLYDLDGHILLLGVDHGSNTSLHVAEARSGLMSVVADAAPILVDGLRQWLELNHVDDDDSDFAAIGNERQGPIGAGVGRLMRNREIVDFGVEWVQLNRT